jgi:hypothetical protein
LVEGCGDAPPNGHRKPQHFLSDGGMSQAFLRRRSAQYFFMRSETAFRALADMRDRRPLRRAAGVDDAAVLLSGMRALGRLPGRNKSGNAWRIAASSDLSSSRRARAPRRASRCSSSRLRSATESSLTETISGASTTLQSSDPKLSTLACKGWVNKDRRRGFRTTRRALLSRSLLRRWRRPASHRQRPSLSHPRDHECRPRL